MEEEDRAGRGKSFWLKLSLLRTPILASQDKVLHLPLLEIWWHSYYCPQGWRDEGRKRLAESRIERANFREACSVAEGCRYGVTW